MNVVKQIVKELSVNLSFPVAKITPYSVTVKGCASPVLEKSCARRLVRFFQPVPLTVLRIPL